jgi:predicted MFS family arabinose efflux permease
VRQRFDFWGLVLLAGAVFCLVYSVIRSETSGWSNPVTLGLLGGAAIMTVVFIGVERRNQAPLLPIHLFANRSISLGVITLLLNFFALYGVLFFVSLYFQNVEHLDAIQAGIRLLPLIGVFSIASPYAGRITKRFGARIPITVGLTLTTASLAAMLVINDHTSFWALCPSLAGIGLGVALVVVASTEAIIASAPVDEAGVAGGLQGIAIQLGGVLGASILGSILAARVGTTLGPDLATQKVPGDVATSVESMKQVVAQGGVPHVGPEWTQAVTSASHAAFLSGLRLALLIGAAATLLGALCGPGINANLEDLDGSTRVPI